MNNNNSQRKRKLAYRLRHRLLSIDRDSKDLKQRVFLALRDHDRDSPHVDLNDAPWLPNKQCGSWYLPPDESDTGTTEVYFKSTDGHVGTYAISLKRLNLPLLEVLHRRGGSCFLVDSSVRKILPDSFSRTVPIWCSVINRLVAKYRAETGTITAADDEGDDWDRGLHTPSSVVSPKEHLEISNLIDSRVELLYRSKAVVDPQRLVRIVTKPVRAVWVANGEVQPDTIPRPGHDPEKFFTIVCCNPSYYFEGTDPGTGSKSHLRWMEEAGDGDEGIVPPGGSSPRGYCYTPGAADDEATWARRLTPQLWWANREDLLRPPRTDDETDALVRPPRTDDEMDALVDSIVNEPQPRRNDDEDDSEPTTNAHKIGDMNLWIGSRRAGRPPECWDDFDCVLNVTKTEYPNLDRSIKERRDVRREARYYLQLPVAEGKRDKAELERWMPTGLVFLMEHLRRGRRVLVHCAQGRDRSAAIVVAFAALACPPLFPLRPKPEFDRLVAELARVEEGDGPYRHSGLARSLVGILLKENGREVFLERMHRQLGAPLDKPLADKDSLRIILHLVRQDRENADPTRSTMQKLNRFFMSSPLYRSKQLSAPPNRPLANKDSVKGLCPSS